MAKSFIDSVVENTGLIAAVASFGIIAYNAHQDHVRNLQNKEASKWGRESMARMRAMISHAKKNRISEEGFADMIGAAKNVLLHEAHDHSNPLIMEEARKLTAYLDSVAA